MATNCILMDFWTWSETTPEQYAINGVIARSNQFEDDYPLFYNQLLVYAQNACNKKKLTYQEIDDILTIMALDHEGENVLDYLSNLPDLNIVLSIIQVGVSHLQPNARWQIAELTYRTKVKGYIEILKKMSQDKDEYVKKRVRNCLNYLSSQQL